MDRVACHWLFIDADCVTRSVSLSPDRSVSNRADIGNVRHERIGAILAEIGLCYLVRDWRDFSS